MNPVAALIILHSLTGAEVVVNPQLITSMQRAAPGQPNKNFAEGAKCVVNLVDGKFVTVVETCDEVRNKIEGRRQ